MARIMIVDNEPFTIKVLTQILASAGHTVSPASGAQKCLDLLGSEKPDLILMDIMMPEMSGWDAVEQIRSDPRYKKIKIIMLSAKQKETDSALLNLSDGYIPKPFERKQILEAIDKILPAK